MTLICAWCTHANRKQPTNPGEIVSHGICEVCAKKLKAGEFEDADFPQPGLDQPPKSP